MNTNPTPLDLDAIEADLDERSPARDPSDRNRVRALIEEAKRLREKIAVDRAMFEAFRPEVVAEVAVLVCDEMDWQAVATWCGATISSSSDMSGEYHSTIDIPGVGSAREGQWIIQRHDGTFAIRATLEGPSAESVARLTAHPAPAWDEEAVVDGMARAVYPLLFTDDDRQPLRVFGEARSDAELRDGERDVARERMRQALAVVRDHLPVKPDREALAQKAFEAAGRDDWGVANDLERDEWLDVADAVLDLLPGRSEAEVKAEGAVEALREVAARYRHHDAQGYLYVSHEDLAQVPWETVARDLDVSADRLAAEGGDDRG